MQWEVAALDEELKLAIKAYDEFTSIMSKFGGALEGVEKAEKTVAAATESLNKTVSVFLDSVQKTGPPLQRRKKATDDVADADKKAGKAAHDHGKAVDDLAHSHDQAGKAAHRHHDALDDLVMGLGMLGITAAVAKGFDAVTEAGAGFNRELTILKGMTGQAVETSEQFLNDLQVERKGLGELAVGMNELARAGYDATDAMTALPEIAQFSGASFKSIGEAGAPVLQILKTFQKDVRDTGEVTDVLTMAANRSALGFDDFQLGLAMSAGVAKMAGQNYQELVAELSVLRDAGLGASDAGTSIKSAWLALMNPTEEAKQVMKDLNISVYDSQGRMKSWADIVASTEKALRPLNEQSKNLALTTVFGSDGVRAMALSMGRGSDYIRGLTADLQNSRGATAELANEMGQSFTGSLERVQANLEKLKITLFQDIEGGLSGMLNALDTLVVGFNSLGGAARGLIEFLTGSAGVVVAMAAVVAFGKTMVIPMLEGVKLAFATAATAGESFGAIVAALGGPVTIAIMAITALVVGVTAYVGAQEKARAEAERQDRAMMSLADRYGELQKAMDGAGRSDADRKRAAEEQKQVIKEIGDQFPALVKRWDEHGNAVEVDTARLEANTRAARENIKAKSEADMALLGSEVESLQKQRDRVQQDLANLQQNGQTYTTPTMVGGLLPGGAPVQMTPKDQSALQKELAAINGQIESALAKMGRLSAMITGTAEETGPDYLDPRRMPKNSVGGGTQTYDADADKKREDAEKARTTAIRDQMDLLRHLVAMDDERVDTAAEQLAFLQRIRTTYGDTRELAEAIHKAEQEIARAPLQEQLAAFEKRRQLGELTAREEQFFYENLVKNAEQLHLTAKEREQYEVQAAVARKEADRETGELLIQGYRDQVQLTDMSTRDQLTKLRLIRDTFAEGSRERRQLDIEVHELEKRLQEETHDQALAEIEFNAIVNRETNDQKLAALKQYLATAKDLTIQQQRELQQEIAQMEQQAERDHQQTLLDLYREGLEAERRIKEKELRDRQAREIDAKEKEIADLQAYYEGLLSPLQAELEAMQEQTAELERQKRLLEIQNELKKIDQELADTRAIKNRVVLEYDENGNPVMRRTYDEQKERELIERRKEIEQQYQDELAKQQEERARESLQRQIKLLQQERDAKLKALTEELQTLRTEHGKQLEALQTYWNDRLSTQKLQAELESTGWKNHYQDVLTQTQNWVKDMNEAWSKLQQPMLQYGEDLSNRLGNAPTAPPPPDDGESRGHGRRQPPHNINQNFYGDHHYNGVDDVAAAAAAFADGARSYLRRK